jgi:hypothetical protein
MGVALEVHTAISSCSATLGSKDDSTMSCSPLDGLLLPFFALAIARFVALRSCFSALAASFFALRIADCSDHTL